MAVLCPVASPSGSTTFSSSSSIVLSVQKDSGTAGGGGGLWKSNTRSSTQTEALDQYGFDSILSGLRGSYSLALMSR